MIHDLRYALRMLRKQPAFTTAAILTLGLGIGASTAVYTLLKRVVLDPLPYPQADRLVRLKSAVPGVAPDEEWNLASAQYFHFRSHATSLAELGPYQRTGLTLRGPEEAVRADAALVTPGTLWIVGARAAVGRLIDERDAAPGAPTVAVLGSGFWHRRYGGDPAVIGRALDLEWAAAEIVGVMAPGIELPAERGEAFPGGVDVWIPYPLDPAGPFSNSHVVPVLSRLAPGATLEQARAELDRLTAALPRAYPQVYSAEFMQKYGFGTRVHPLQEYVVGDAAQHLWILFGAVGIVLLIAWANVVNLFIVRIEGRRREFAVRSALGAGGGALVRALAAEGLVVALAGGAAGLLLASWIMDWLVAGASVMIPRLEALRLDTDIVLFALAISILVALGLAIVPALSGGRAWHAAALADGGRPGAAGAGRTRVRSALVAAQVALALVLIVGAGLLLESFRRLRGTDPGIRPDGVLTMQVHVPPARYDTLDKMWRFYGELLTRIEALPGAGRAGVSRALPFTGSYGCTVQFFEDPDVKSRVDEHTACAALTPTSPGYFEALGIPLLQGRTLTVEDHEQPGRGAVVVSRAFAERFWPGQDPLGKGVRPHGDGPPFYRVVGVVGDVAGSSLAEPPAIAIYYPIVAIPGQPRWSIGSMYLAVRADLANPVALLPGIRQAVREVDPAIPIANAAEMRAIVDRSMSRLAFTLTLLAAAAAMALLLAAIGLYGVISYVVARRTGEIGVRMALGAQPHDVERLVVRGALRLAGVGLVLGVVGALALSRAARGLLYGVAPTDPATYVTAAVVLILVAAAASWIPARRAARIDPVTALRAD